MQKVNVGTAYLLWCLSLFGVCGVQRLYTGKTVSGIIYLLTFGLFGVGQFVDLVLIPGMVEKRRKALMGSITPQPTLTRNVADETAPMLKLLRAAAQNHGKLSMAQAALYTELEPDAVKDLLLEAVRAGYAEISNDPETGAIRYHFDL